MTQPERLSCIRCGRDYTLAQYDRACETCAGEGIASNLTVAYADADAAPRKDDIPDTPRSLWRFAAHLPLGLDDAVTLGEGDTPLVRLDGWGHHRVFVKDEGRNPTWSFKDRLATVAVSWAKKTGARTIVTSSTGNAGAAAAAYAARAGLGCVVLTTADAGGTMVRQMQGYGAKILTVPTKDDRWDVVAMAVREFGWFPTSPFFGPAAGSNPIGIEGYKTLAYEIAEQLGWRAPDWCVLPVCYGDALYGMWKGFEEMRRWGWTDTVPRLVAAEVSGSLAAAVDRDAVMPPEVPRANASIAASIDVVRGTYQALHAVTRSNGLALTVDDASITEGRDRLASRSGLLVEASSAAAFVAFDKLVAVSTIGSDETAVVVSTASGLKDLGVGDAGGAEPPSVTADPESVARALKEGYGVDV